MRADGGGRGDGLPIVRLLSVGRFSREKDQVTILRALRFSSHARSIELTLAGRGPTERRLRKLSDRLVRDGVIEHPVRFACMGPEEMARASREADLYVHAARIEVEGLGALEVLRHGVVPVLARGPLAATSQFALSEESVFEAGIRVRLPVRSTAGSIAVVRIVGSRRLAIGVWGLSMTSVRAWVSWSGSIAGWSREGSSLVRSLTVLTGFIQLQGNCPRR